MKTLVSFLIALSALAGLTACNTVKGVGQDIQRAGGALEDAAKKK